MEKKKYPMLSSLDIFKKLLKAVVYDKKGIILSGICFS